MAEFKPLTAPIWQRSISFLLDIILAFSIIGFVMVKFLLPAEYPNELGYLMEYTVALQSANEVGGEQPVLEMTMELQTMFVYVINVIILFLWFYFFFNSAMYRGGSLGKRVFNLTVVDSGTYMPLAFFQNLSRSGIKASTLLYWFPVPFVINFCIVFFNERKYSGHDYISKTLVVVSTQSLLRYQNKMLIDQEKKEEESSDEG